MIITGRSMLQIGEEGLNMMFRRYLILTRRLRQLTRSTYLNGSDLYFRVDLLVRSRRFRPLIVIRPGRRVIQLQIRLKSSSPSFSFYIRVG